MNVETLHTFDTEYSADSVEWCNENDRIFVVGTYQLVEKDESNSISSRKGRIYLFTYNYDNNILSMTQQIDTDAILDQKWLGKFLITASSIGNIQKYCLCDDNNLSKATETKLYTGESDILALSIDVKVGSSKILASDSLGRLSLLDIGATTPIIRQWKAHEFEAWTCAFNKYSEDVVFSGKLSQIM